MADANAVNQKETNGKKFGIRGHLYEIYHHMKMKRTPTGIREGVTQASIEEMTVTGLYIQHSPRPSQKVLLWIYGGAFLAGDSKGNSGIAEKMGMLCADEDGGSCGNSNGMRDVFIPDYRLVPEHHLDDAIHDITLAYEYLIYERNIRPEDIILVGVSSGGGLVVLLLQALAKAKLKFEEKKNAGMGGDDMSSTSCVSLPAGGVMMGPFVDYSEPKGSMKKYIKHDLIVNQVRNCSLRAGTLCVQLPTQSLTSYRQSVYDEGIPFLEKVLGSHENRVKASPVYGSFEGLPPLCICVSKHEVVYDQAMLLAKRAKEQGVDVTIGVWKYM